MTTMTKMKCVYEHAFTITTPGNAPAREGPHYCRYCHRTVHCAPVATVQPGTPQKSNPFADTEPA